MLCTKDRYPLSIIRKLVRTMDAAWDEADLKRRLDVLSLD